MKKINFCLFGLFLFFSNVFSYDKISVISFLSDEGFSDARYLNVYNDKLYVLKAKKINIYTSTLSFISSFDLNLENPVSFSICDGKIYIVDEKKSSVYVYDLEGKIIYNFAHQGKEKGSLSSPSDIVCYGGKIYVSDTSNKRINVYTDNGVFLYDFVPLNKNGLALTPSRIFFDPYGEIYILDIKNNTVLKYTKKGKLIEEFSTKDYILAVTDYGFIYGGGPDGKIREYDLYFKQKGIFGTKGKNKYEFLNFADIKPYNDGIFVLDDKNKKILYLNVENKDVIPHKKEVKKDDRITVSFEKTIPLEAKTFTVGKEGIIYYTDKKNRSGIYLKTEKEDKIISFSGEDEKSVKDVSSLFLGKDGKIYVVDSGKYNVKVFNNFTYEFSFGDRIGLFGKEKDGKFSDPRSISLDINENIYVLDSKLKMIQVFNKDGIFLYSISLENIDARENFLEILNDENGNIILLGALKKVYFLDKTGKLLKNFELNELTKPLSFAYDGYEYIFVLDKEQRVYVFDRDGKYISAFFSKTPNLQGFVNATKLNIYDNKLYVLDSNRISVFNIHYTEPVKNITVDYKNEKITLKWNVDIKNLIKEFEILKSTGVNYFSLSKTNNLEFEDTNLSYGATSYYKVKSVSISDNEYISVPVSVYIELPTITSSTQATVSIHKPPLEIIPANLSYIFSANYKYYNENPVGTVSIKNNTKDIFENIKVSFFIKEYMDFPSDFVIDKLEPDELKDLPLRATLNNKILTINETTPVQSQLTVKYYVNNNEKEVSLNFPVKILSKDSIIWDDPRRISNFITIKDPFIFQIAKSVAAKKDEYKYNLDPNIITYVLFMNYIKLSGVKYLEDPVTPYKIAKSSVIIDSVNYPRNTLKLKTGDCDELTALYASLFEAAGIRTVIMDYPDHITLMFETKNKDIIDIGIPKDFLIEFEGSYFVPVEVTMLSKSPYESISYASSLYKSNSSKVKFYDTRQALRIYEPPTLDFKDEELQKMDGLFDDKVTGDLNDIKKKNFEFYESYYSTILKTDPDDIKSKLEFGVLCSLNENFDKAKELFESILKDDEKNSSALNNLGNIYFLENDYQKAKEYYEKAYKYDPYDANIILNIVRVYVKLGKNDDAETFFKKAVSMNKELVKYKDEIFK